MDRVSRFAKPASLVGVTLLVAFHAWLFAGRLAGGELMEPAVAARWLASAGLVAVLLGLRRAGVPLFHGRRALVFWVLVVLLHWTATPLADRGLPVEELLVAAPSVLTLMAGSWLLAGGLRRVRPTRPARPSLSRRVPSRVSPTAQWLLPVLAARPPPV